MASHEIDPVVAALLVAILTRQPLVVDDAPVRGVAAKPGAAGRSTPRRVAQKRAPRPNRKG